MRQKPKHSNSVHIPLPNLDKKFARGTAAVVTTVVMISATIVGTSQAAETDLVDGTPWVTNTASSHSGVEVQKAQIFIKGGDGGNCIAGDGYTVPSPSVAGGAGATVTGVVTFAGTNTLLTGVGEKGGDCISWDPSASPTVGGLGGAGGFSGGNGSQADSASSASYRLLTLSGAGGGGSTVVYLNSISTANALAIAGGGGGAGGTAPCPTSAPSPFYGGAGGDAGQTGENGGDGQAGCKYPAANANTIAPGDPGEAGTVAATPGLNATKSVCLTDYPLTYCGGGGGNGGGAAGKAAGSGQIEYLGTPSPVNAGVGGGGGAGGNSTTSNLTDVTFNTAPTSGSGTGTAGHAKILWADIPAGSVNDASLGQPFSGTTFAAEADPASVSGTTWSLLAGAPPGLTIDSNTGAVGGTASMTDGTYTFKVQATVTATLGSNPQAELISTKELTVVVGSGTPSPTPTPTPTPSPSPTPTPGPVAPPAKPRDTKVTGRPTAKKFKVSWKTPANKSGKRPTTSYRLVLWQTKSSSVRSKKRLMTKRKLKASTHSYTFSRKWLLRNSVRMRGEFGGRALYYRVRVEAFNSKGGGPVSARSFWVKL